MNYGAVTALNNGVLIHDVTHFALDETLDNGQAFRWQPVEHHTAYYHGVAFDTHVGILHQENQLLLQGVTLDHFHAYWEEYLDLSTDYGEIKRLFSQDNTLTKAMTYAPGVRILQQDPWEMLVTFIFSQNNHIPRIKGLVHRFCENFGKPLPVNQEVASCYQKLGKEPPIFHSFPTPETIATLTVEDLEPVRAGFRSKYVLAAAKEVVSGTVSLELPYTLPIEEAREHLMQIYGVGPKVADCVLLFGFHRMEVFPKDVWINRALNQFYPHGFPKELTPWGGIAQQYLFYYTREHPELIPKETATPKKKNKKS